eukprot:COSAG01_NODE_53448_length_339_cov_0.687500_1_plen_52_part_10
MGHQLGGQVGRRHHLVAALHSCIYQAANCPRCTYWGTILARCKPTPAPTHWV